MDSGLVTKLQAGEPGAFESLVEEFQDKVVNTCYGFMHNKEDAEDTAQEVFIEIYRSINHFKEESRLSTWIYRIAVTKSLDALKKKNRKKRFAQIRGFFSDEKLGEEAFESSDSNPQEDLETNERRKILKQAVDSLAENQRIAITLFQYEGYSYSDITEIMETTLSAVESLIHRAKKNLQKKLIHYYQKK